MSYITMFEIKDHKMKFSKKHFREVLRAINDGKYLRYKGRDIDCGYILIDHQKKVLVSSQSGFALHHLKQDKKNELKGWYVLEI